jgi:vacuolar-type H+-ATPase subunit F/Vma7
MAHAMRIYVIGNENCVLGFALTGVGGRVANTPEQVQQALDDSLRDPDIGLVLISSDAASLLRDRVDGLKRDSLSPLVVEIPGQGEGGAYLPLRDIVQRAIGISLGGV